MASLKSHLLREVVEILRRRFRRDDPSCTTSFLLSGKEPSVIIRRMIENEVISIGKNFKFHSTDKDDIMLWYRGDIVQRRFFKILLLKWVRKLRIRFEKECVLTYPRVGLVKVLCENKDIRELDVSPESIITWTEVFNLYPNLVSVHSSPVQFGQMLVDAPNALTGLEEIGFNFVKRSKDPEMSLANACVALSTHQAKYPSLKVVHFKDLRLRKVQYPDASKIIAIPSVKHVKIDITDEYLSFDFNFLTTIQKMFPSLQTLDMQVEAHRYERYTGPDEFDQFYQAFRSLRLGFSITINSCRELFCFEKEGTELRKRIASKYSIDVRREEVLLTVACESNDIRKLSVDGSAIPTWAEGFKLFPKIVSMQLTPLQFNQMLLNAPNALTSLQEVDFNLGIIREGGLAYVCVVLSKHQAKYPALEVVNFETVYKIQYPDPSKITGIPSVKHFKIDAYKSLDFGFFLTIQKLFPSLKTVDMNINVRPQEDLDLEDQFYQAFHSLSVAFSVKITCRNWMCCSETYATEFREFLATKGTVIENEPCFIVETSLPGKRLIREVHIKIVKPEMRNDREYCTVPGCCGRDSDSESS